MKQAISQTTTSGDTLANSTEQHSGIWEPPAESRFGSGDTRIQQLSGQHRGLSIGQDHEYVVVFRAL